MVETGKQKRVFRITVMLDIVIAGIFVIYATLSVIGNRNIELTTLYFAVTIVALSLANYLLYQYSKREVGFPAETSK